MFTFLKEFFIDAPIEMIQDSPIVGTILMLIMLALLAILFFIIFASSYYILNNSFTKSEKGTATVVSKYFTAKHTVTTTQMMLVGKVMIPTTQTITYPDTWTLIVEREYEQGKVNVSQELFNEVKESTLLDIMYHKGRLDKKFHPENVLGISTQKVD